MSDHYDIDKLLQRIPELIVTVRGYEFRLWREGPGVVRAQTDHEYHRYYASTLADIKVDLEEWRPGKWVPNENQYK